MLTMPIWIVRVIRVWYELRRPGTELLLLSRNGAEVAFEVFGERSAVLHANSHGVVVSWGLNTDEPEAALALLELIAGHAKSITPEAPAAPAGP